MEVEEAEATVVHGEEGRQCRSLNGTEKRSQSHDEQKSTRVMEAVNMNKINFEYFRCKR